MKLIEIKDVIVGQVYQDEDLFYIKNINTYNKMHETNYGISREDYIIKNSKLIGFLNITHKIENNKLVEIPREEFEVGDIVDIIEEYGYDQQHFELVGKAIVLNDKELLTFQPSYTIQEKYEELIYNKIGIYGVTHEFINDKLIKE